MASGKHAVADLTTLARGSTLSFLGTIAKGVLGFVLTLVVTRGLGPRGAGLFFGVVALFTIGEAMRMGADTGLVRYVSRMRAQRDLEVLYPMLVFAVSPVVVITTVVAAMAFVSAPALGDLLFGGDVEQATNAIRILSPFLPLAAVSDVLIGGTRGFGTVVPYVAIESFGKPLLRPLLVFVAIALGTSVVGALAAWAIPVAVGLPVVAAWLLVLARRDTQRDLPRRRGAHYRPLALEFWRFSIPQGFAAILQTAIRWFDIILVGALRSTREVGVYAAVSRTALFGLFAIEALRIAIAPQISSLLAGGHRDRAEGVYRVGTWWLVLVSWPIYLVLAVWAPVILRIFGPGFESGQDALLILSLGMLMSTATGNVGTALLMGGRSGWVLLNTAAALGVNVALNLVLIPAMGIEGAAIAWVASIATGELLALRAAWRHLAMNPFGPGFTVAMLGSFGCFGVLGVLLRVAFGDSMSALLLALAFGTAAYGAVLFRWRSILQITTLWTVIAGKLRPSRRPAGSDS